MKLSFYFDVYPGMNPENITVMVNSSALFHKMACASRYRVDVEVPDPAKPDAVIRGEAVEMEKSELSSPNKRNGE